ncbi:MAG: anti-sigma factor [Pseudomonadota bacterium]
MSQPKDTLDNDTQKMNEVDEYTAAALDRLMEDATPLPPLPPELAAKVINEGEAMVSGFVSPPTHQPERKRSLRWWQNPLPAWGAAIACLVLALGITLGPADDGVSSPLELDAALAGNADAVELSWQGMGDPAFDGVVGYVRWDNATQQGVMRLTGLPVNDPTELQYQLWIVDPLRDSNPIDGGVFNITEGENLVAIDAKLEVIRPKAFALTLEQPGGVVVSAGPLLVIASS